MTSNISNTQNIDKRDNVESKSEQKKYIFAHQHSNQESLCVRIIRKKYKCIMLLLAIAFIVLEISKTILQTQQSIDDLKIVLLLKQISEKNTTTIKNILTSQEIFPEYLG